MVVSILLKKTTLTGRYELKEGAYEMNFNFIKRKFDIKDGSYIHGPVNLPLQTSILLQFIK
jgi:hypothetical protein